MSEIAVHSSTWDWSRVSDDSLREIIRQAELEMAELLVATCAADARATSLSGVYAAISAALMAGTAALTTMQSAELAIFASTITMAVGFLLASLFCVGAARPRDYYTAGNQPRFLLSSADQGRWLLQQTAESLQRRIEHNLNVLAAQADWSEGAHKTSALSVVLAAAAFGALHAYG